MINSNSQIRIGNVARFSSVGSTDTDGETDCLDLAMYESKNIVKSILVGTNEVRRLNLNSKIIILDNIACYENKGNWYAFHIHF